MPPKRISETERGLKRLNDRGGNGAGYRFSALQLGRCPWCGRPLTPGDVKVGPAAGGTDHVILRCSDELGQCPLSKSGGNIPDGLPILTTGEEIYWLAPAFVITTADKLARLAHKGYTVTLFGRVVRRCRRHGYVPYPSHDSTHNFTGYTLGENGRHQPEGELSAAAIRPVTRLRPPSLIIQDKLHFVTEALGTTVGLFETVVETMCAWRAPNGRPARPLLVASSATARNVADQVRSLYDRGVTVFPPQVLGASDILFSRTVLVGAAHPRRLYVGLSTTEIRLAAAEIQTTQTVMAGAQLLLDRLGAAADPYMVLVGYFSATRELAGVARHVQDDIRTGLAKPGHDSRLSRRRGTTFSVLNLGEFASRIASTDITATLDRMALTFDPSVDPTTTEATVAVAAQAGKKVERRDPEANPYDVVLATSMLQVGVDVSRLGLMFVVGQSKNTTEYIQATSHVGRDADRPGLVITLSNWIRPHGLAHYEQFHRFHEIFYTHVKPLTVTPFSVIAINRGLDGILVTAARVTQAGCNNGLNSEHNTGRVTERAGALERLVDKLSIRISAAADEEENKYARDRLASHVREWKKHQQEVAEKNDDPAYKRGADDVRHFPLLCLAESASRSGSRPDGDPFTVTGPMREVQSEISLLVSPDPTRPVDGSTDDAPAWERQESRGDRDTSDARTDQEKR